MDRNQLVGLTLISVMLITYAHFFTPQLPEPTEPAATEAVEVPAANAVIAPSTPAEDSPFVVAAHGNEQEVTLENEAMRVVFSSKGGHVKEVILKKYQDHQGQPLKLLDAQSSSIGLQFSSDGILLNTTDLFFEVTPEETGQVAFTLTLAPGQYIRQLFSLANEGYTLTHQWEMVGLDGVVDKVPMQLVWHDGIRQTEQDIEASKNKTTVNYYLADGRFKQLKERSQQLEEADLEKPIQWVSAKQRFFTAAVIAQEPFLSGRVAIQPTPDRQKTFKEADMHLTLPLADGDTKGQLTFYFGPNDYRILSKVAPGFSRNVTLGWPIVRWINYLFIIPVFSFLEQYISNYGLIIIVLVVIIKALLFPLSYRSYISMAKMRVMKPALDAIKEKYGDDLQKVQMEQFSLYQEVGINPLSSLVPNLLQIPIFIAMFNFFPNAIALRQQPFLWASDLSTYDAIVHLPFHIPIYGGHISLFALLMTVSTVLYSWSSNQLADAQQPGAMQMFTYVMPFTFLFVLNSFPAGITLYYFVSNLFTFVQQSLISWAVDEEKIKEQLEENKQKYKNNQKSRIQHQLQAAMKAERSARKSAK